MFLWVKNVEDTSSTRCCFRRTSLTVAIIQTSRVIVRGAPWRESKRAVATSNVASRSSLLRRGKRKISGSLVEKSTTESGARRSWSFMSACCTVAPAGNFFPGVKSLSSPPRFPKKGYRTWKGGKNAPQGVGKFYVVRRVRGRRGTLSRARPKAFARRRYNFNHSSAR